MLVEGDVERQYMLWFQEPGVAEAAMEPNIPEMFRKLMVGGIPLDVVMGRAFADGKLDMNPFRDIPAMEPMGEPMASDAEIEHYAEVFGRTGLRGPINWYRNLDRNVRLYPDVAKSDPGVPCLMLCAEWDPALPPAMSEGMAGTISDLERHIVPEAGHWVQQESPAATNAFLIDWLQRRFGA
jgi:soluble epoxide hydrolase/lipid-phosphate phosphatase